MSFPEISEEGVNGAGVAVIPAGTEAANGRCLACLAIDVRAVVRGSASGKRIIDIELSSMDSRRGSLTRPLTRSSITPICPPATRTNTRNRLDRDRPVRITPKTHLFSDSTDGTNVRSQMVKIHGARELFARVESKRREGRCGSDHWDHCDLDCVDGVSVVDR
jgi:hypothetical protein